MLIASDEIYEHLLYDGAKHQSVASLSPAHQAHTVIVHGFAKAPERMTGWRLGFLAAPGRSPRSHRCGAVPRTSGPFAKRRRRGGAPQDHLPHWLARYARRRTYAWQSPFRTGITCVNSRGAFYLFPNDCGTGLKSADFCARLLGQERSPPSRASPLAPMTTSASATPRAWPTSKGLDCPMGRRGLVIRASKPGHLDRLHRSTASLQTGGGLHRESGEVNPQPAPYHLVGHHVQGPHGVSRNPILARQSEFVRQPAGVATTAAGSWFPASAGSPSFPPPTGASGDWAPTSAGDPGLRHELSFPGADLSQDSSHRHWPVNMGPLRIVHEGGFVREDRSSFPH